MNSKDIVKTCLIILLITIAVFIFYLLFIRPHLTGSYVPTQKDCKNSYNCTCVGNSCLCSYSKWFIENQVVCDKDIILDKQMK